MDKQALIRLFNYHYWANDQLWRSVASLSDRQFTRPLNDGGPSIRTQIVSMVANENLWVNYLWHGEVEFLHESQLPTRASIREEWDALEEEMRDFIHELNPADLASRVEPAFLGTDVSFQVWEILLQVINHATDCRARVCLHMQRLGSAGFAQDFFSFLAGQVGANALREAITRASAPLLSYH